MDSVDFIQPHSFAPLDPPELFSSERDGKIFSEEAKFSLTSGYPYDVLEDVPASGGTVPYTTKARGGAVHFKNLVSPGQTYPPIDRGFFFEVNDNEVTTKSFWEDPARDYLQTRVARGNVGLWGYNNQGARNFALSASDQDAAAFLRLYSQDSDKYAALNIDNEKSELYGYVTNGTKNFLLKADGLGASLSLNKDQKGFFASQEKVLVFDSNGSFAALYGDGGLQIHNGLNNNDLVLRPYLLELKDGGGSTGSYEAGQLTFTGNNKSLIARPDGIWGHAEQDQYSLGPFGVSGTMLNGDDTFSLSGHGLRMKNATRTFYLNAETAGWVTLDICYQGVAVTAQVLVYNMDQIEAAVAAATGATS